MLCGICSKLNLKKGDSVIRHKESPAWWQQPWKNLWCLLVVLRDLQLKSRPSF